MKVNINVKRLLNSQRATLKDEHGTPIVTFEDKVTVLGGKTSVYDAGGKEIYFIDQDAFSSDNEVVIYKGLDAVASVKRKLRGIQRVIEIESNDGIYKFSALANQMLKDGEVAFTIKKPIGLQAKEYSIEIKDVKNVEFLLTLAYVMQKIAT